MREGRNRLVGGFVEQPDLPAAFRHLFKSCEAQVFDLDTILPYSPLRLLRGDSY